MAQNVWNATLDPNNNIKQNSFDWTHVNNLTTQIGRITPIQCELVPAKTSFRVKPFPALQLMPMVFPIQTRMRATISYFRYPLRALWKDYKDFEGNFREDLEEPYHDFNSQTLLNKMLGTGKLMDYLGVPTTLNGSYGFERSYPFLGLSGSSNVTNFDPFHTNNTRLLYVDNSSDIVSQVAPGEDKFSDFVTGGASNGSFWGAVIIDNVDDIVKDNTTMYVQVPANISDFSQDYCFLAFFDGSDYLIDANEPLNYTPSTGVINFPLTDRIKQATIRRAVFFIKQMSSTTTILPYMKSEGVVGFGSPSWFVTLVGNTLGDLTLKTSPYYNSNSQDKDKQIKLSAYAARAYEGIYNSVYRDNRNNPYYVNNVIQYNQWIPSYAGGADSYPYELRYANWEKDFLTTAVQSPQQGNAPLVGITTYEQSSVVTNESGEPTTVKQTKVAMVDEEGRRYSLEFESDSDELKDVKYVELDNGTTVRSVRSLFDLVTSGISITDLRNVNAYQKFLELNMRKGYSYKEIIEGRFDVKVRYADLLLPEFFGGFSRDINMNAVTQTVDQDFSGSGSYKDALGSQAGIGYFRGGTDANIECFCDEESIIMGLLVITPLPVYTQLLPKHFLYRGLLDHFNPEFNNISFQPITYKEVCPIQAYNENPDTLTQTFGYQRPWYEYCQRYDQAHGLFRTDLSNFLMHRVFNQKPELAQSFLIIDPSQVTDVFSVTETTDKVYGQILLDCTVKLPVARVAIPRLD